jgi:predicted lipoprotein with Yx(FWY)xxD motif
VSRTLPRRPGIAAALALCLLLPACGGGGEKAGTAAAGAATVNTLELPGYGEVLATKDGRPLFMFTSDPEGGSACKDACAQEWPPLLVDGELTAAPGVDASKLSSFDRGDGDKQVLYNDHALYMRHGEDLLEGVGAEAHGGTWYLVSTEGKAIEMTEAGGY